MLSQLKDIYKRLRNDYNGDILEEKQNEGVKRLFKKVSSELKEKNKTVLPLANIVYNHFNGVLPTPDYISGPMSLSYHTSEEYGIKVYIFGEAHGSENTCDKIEELRSSPKMNVSHYLQQIFLNSDKFIDFYLEEIIFTTTPPPEEQDNFIENLSRDFHNCLNPEKRKDCVFKTVRTHYVDTRNIEKNGLQLETTKFGKMIKDLDESNFRLSSTKKRLYNSFIKELSELDSYEAIANYIIKTALDVPIIQKEVKKCYLDKELLLSTFRKVLVERLQYDIDIEELRDADISRTPSKILDSLLIILEAPIVDLYTIARMFKIFRKEKYYPPKPRYIIYYAGNAHSIIVRMFLSALKFKEKFFRESNQYSNSRCLNMSGIVLNFK